MHRYLLAAAWMFAVGQGFASQPSTVLMLPPLSPPVSATAQDALLAACRSLWERQQKWVVVTFHRESPSLVRAVKEGRLPADALTRPLDHAVAVCAEEGAQVGMWLRVTRADDATPQAMEAMLLVPTAASFQADLQTQPITETERALLKPFQVAERQLAAWVLALRLGQWLQDRLAPPTPLSAPSAPGADGDQDVAALVAAEKWDDAVRRIDQLLQSNPNDPRLYWQLAVIYERQGRWEDATIEYRRALQLQSDLWEAWKGLARVAAKRERWDWVLEAVQRLQSAQRSDPLSLALGAQAAAVLAATARQRGRDREADAYQQLSLTLDEAVVQTADDPQLLLDAAQRLMTHQRLNVAARAIEKLMGVADAALLDQAVPLAVAAKRPDLAYRLLLARLRFKAPYAPSPEPMRVCGEALNAETVRLFEAVRDTLAAFDRRALNAAELQTQLRKVNADAEQLLKAAQNIRPPEAWAALYKRRLLAYELFLQATALLREWAETQDGLTRTRAVVLYDFARSELESVWAEERRLAP
ncbi:hypothetical protein HRbin17_01491 [bacterium HR17]|jgi:tetratricopeptide (TPR) repeat protein|uniref:Uncharacterized protein n=1 Tax=Candidatus Fervidibacter japonicus TaxID=2035412 RepID=A0A2H5XCR0_9BACT|nr:hypothetical protein HRbin17_01491 [bacterium HR17]